MPDTKALRYAEETYFLARRLKDSLPNEKIIDGFPKLNPPECFPNEIGLANGIYCAGIAFLYAHEYAHHYLGHTEIPNTYKHSIEDETAADNFALDAVSDLFDTNYGITYITGICTVLAALLLTGRDSVTGEGTHPDMDVRIRNAVSYLDLPETHYI